MPPAPAHPADSIARARLMYAQGARVRDICKATGMSIGALYYHLDGFSLPGAAVQRLPRRRDAAGHAAASPASRGRKKLAARLWRAAERQAQKLEFSLTWDHQRPEQRAHDLAALKELARILKDLAAFEDSAFRAGAGQPRGAVEQEHALAVEGRAVYISRTRRA